MREIDGIGAFAQDLALRSFLSALFEKAAHILEIIGIGVGSKCLRRRQRLAVTRKDVADLALRDGDKIGAMHRILERHEEMQAAAHDFRLVACLTVERYEAITDGAAKAP